MAQPTHYTVTSSFVGNLGGREVEYHAGEVVEASDPAVKKMPDHFAPLVVRGGSDRGAVEQATSAPGEKRKIGILGKKTSKPRPATPAEEAGIAETVEAEAEAEKVEEEPQGHALTSADLKRPWER